ncbi:AzlD domain-containing protein [Fictibacillus sp. WQ 8-8]|uniref:AzlD domain-containing protein n=1 Tax=Fictibacillus marinisediminis TaxID=2878389 RepID=A0A9X1X8M3_9BACL|nr:MULTISPECIES: AzlD domain-containing protein [Fictibacillus]MCK6255933.1 AzlD domain-containing protein [Fictibacillus marinisediminis]MCQ6266977.1 AzlD domain-containing protein [Fictibacillus sp. WQ 8-8]
MENNLLWMIAGMGVVTYLPRVLPLVLINTNRIPPRLQRILSNVPFAILGALIFPGILHINGDSMWFGLLGACVAGLTAYLNWNIILVVLSSVAALSICSFFMG